MGFYWKYSRNGWKSRSYQSFIIDVLPSSWSSSGNRRVWNTSFEELQVFLILLQDIELRNNPSVGITKPDFDKYVRELGYEATLSYRISGHKYALGEAVMGRHLGYPLPWGFYSDDTTPIKLDITNLRYDYVVPIDSDKAIDMLSYCKGHPNFERSGNYWDYMPMHSCLLDIVRAMINFDRERTRNFLVNVLKWNEL